MKMRCGGLVEGRGDWLVQIGGGGKGVARKYCIYVQNCQRINQCVYILRSGYKSMIQYMRSGGKRIRSPRLPWAVECTGGQLGLQEIPDQKRGRGERKMFDCSRLYEGLRNRGYGAPQLLFVKKQIPQGGRGKPIKEEVTEKSTLGT